MISPWLVVVSSLVAAAAVAAYLAGTHRPLVSIIRELSGEP